jgi:phage repressor protein C with HTH and peptisase S24 domain
MVDFGGLIDTLRRKKHWTQRQLAERTGLALDTVNRALKQPTPRALQTRTYTALANAFGMTVEELDALWEQSQPPAAHRSHGAIPVINKTQAGYSHDYQDVGMDQHDHILLDPSVVGDPDAFACEVAGDSMQPEFNEGDIVVFTTKQYPQDGDACFIQFRGEGEGNTFKYVRRIDDETVQLIPGNLERWPARYAATGDIALMAPVAYKLVSYRGLGRGRAEST